MKVAYLASVLSPAAGGLAASVPAMAHGLDRLPGIETHVLGSSDPARPLAWRDWGPRVEAFPTRGPGAFRYAPALAARLADLDPDLVDVQGLWTYPSLASLRRHRRTGRPYVVTPRGMLDPWARNRSRLKKALVRAWFEDAHIREATCLRATAGMEADHFRAMGLRQPIAVVPNGVDLPAEVAPHDGDGPRRLLFLSRVHPKKGIAELLAAWAELEPRHPDWELVIAGFDEVGHTAAMRARAAELGLRRVTWPGEVLGEAKDRLYRSAHAFVLPTHAENFGLVIAEALAYGLPVVTTRNAPWEGLGTHGCGRWIDLRHEALLAALGDVMSLSDDERRAMGRRGRDWMGADFGWDAVARQMAEAYRWVLSGGPAPAFVRLD